MASSREFSCQWVGRCRCGVIKVFDAALDPFDGAVACERFSSSAQLWTQAEARIVASHKNSADALRVAVLGMDINNEAIPNWFFRTAKG